MGSVSFPEVEKDTHKRARVIESEREGMREVQDNICFAGDFSHTHTLLLLPSTAGQALKHEFFYLLTGTKVGNQLRNSPSHLVSRTETLSI